MPAAEPTESAEMSGLVDEVERQFAAMFVLARRGVRERAASVHPDLPPVGFAIMTSLARVGDVQQVELAERLGMDKGVVSRAVKQLERLGLVERGRDPRDGRAHLVGLSPEGRRRYEVVGRRQREILHEKLGQWDPQEVRHFADLLARLNEAR